MILTMNARQFQRTHPLSGMGFSLNASKDTGMGVTHIAFVCEPDPAMDAVKTAVVGSARTRGLEAGSDREDRSSDVCYDGDIRSSFSEKDDDIILHSSSLLEEGQGAIWPSQLGHGKGRGNQKVGIWF